MARLPDGLGPTRRTLHRVAAHILGRGRHRVTGRFGLRATPGGFGTPAFGDAPDVLRVSGVSLVCERGAEVRVVPVAGSTMAQLATVARLDLSGAFTVGAETPELGSVDEPLMLDGSAAEVLADWFAAGSRALDRLQSELPADADPATVQLWPEHFDLGTDVPVGPGRRTNLGVSAGDAGTEEPYLYVGPWGDERPGPPAFWNAPFGAVRRLRDLSGPPEEEAVAFFLEGVARLRDRPR